jgi:hypothetical protein
MYDFIALYLALIDSGNGANEKAYFGKVDETARAHD